MRRRSVTAGALLLSTTALCGALVFEGGPDSVIFPKQKLTVWFSHAYHTQKVDEAKGLSGEGLECEFCHENVGESLLSSDRDIPGHGSCDSCHDEWIGEEDAPAPIADCARCHRDLDTTTGATIAAALDIPPPNIIFPHARHTKADIACVECHDQVPKKTLATRDDYPTMDRCIQCHFERGVSIECKTCHITGRGGRIETSYPQGKLQPRRLHSFAIHDANFLKDHAVPAKRERAFCDTCHTEDDCLSCHDGIGRDVRYHPGDWVSTHFVKAKKDDTRCQSCHRLQSFCLNCHIRSGVASVWEVSRPFNATHFSVRRDSRGLANGPHPMAADGWNNPASRNFHGFQAQRNIRSCASCHQEQYCLQCHMSKFDTGLKASRGGNPHGPNPQRLKGSTASKQNARMCLKCHHPNDDTWR